MSHTKSTSQMIPNTTHPLQVYIKYCWDQAYDRVGVQPFAYEDSNGPEFKNGPNQMLFIVNVLEKKCDV